MKKLFESEYQVNSAGSCGWEEGASVSFLAVDGDPLTDKVSIGCTRDQAQAFGPHLYRKVRVTISLVENGDEHADRSPDGDSS